VETIRFSAREEFQRLIDAQSQDNG